MKIRPVVQSLCEGADGGLCLLFEWLNSLRGQSKMLVTSAYMRKYKDCIIIMDRAYTCTLKCTRISEQHPPISLLTRFTSRGVVTITVLASFTAKTLLSWGRLRCCGSINSSCCLTPSCTRAGVPLNVMVFIQYAKYDCVA